MLGYNRKTCNHFLKSKCISELSWNFLKNTDAQVLLFSTRNVSNEQPCLKTTGLYEDLLLLSRLHHFFHLILRAPISLSSCFPISSSLLFFFFLMFFLMSLSSIVEKLLYVNNMYNMYILEKMTFCLTKKFMTF